MLTAVSLALACLGCTDATPTLAASPPDAPALLATVECAVDLRAGGSVTCKDPAPAAGDDGPALALLGTNQIRMRSANGVSDTAAQAFSMEATAQNLLSYPIGTPDGQAVTGLKVFFETGPAATAYYAPGDTGTVMVRNPDGYQNFTAARQPYHFYDTILQPQQTTRPKRWEFHVPRTVARFGFTVRVFTATPRDRDIPDLVPDTVPRSIYNADNLAADEDGSTVVRDVVVLKFFRGTSLEERRSAIEAIDGRVIGGRRIGGQDGEYYVRITPPDSSAKSLNQALRSLRRLPQVQYAAAEAVDAFSPDYRLPDDPGPPGQTWRLNPDSADGYNWGSELIQLPFAWGCETGTTRPAVAIVDDQFRVTGELQPNVTTTFGIDSAGPSAWGHGTAVASLVAARGNNGAGLTGIAWNADLRLYSVEVDGAGAVVSRDTAGNPRTPLPNILAQIDRAARDGARVINLSYGRSYEGATPGSLPQHAVSLATNAERVRALVAQLDEDGFRPLFVFSAGNDSADARWNVFPTLKQHFAERVIVVGAADRVGPNRYVLHRTSNRGTLVDVLAPGDSVGTMRSDGAFIGMGETSIAAPHVSGLAALLFSFDPELTPERVKEHIVRGAALGNRGVPGHTFRLINAYESLKLAAQRPGAPLCGNRVWSDGGRLIAQRTNGPDTLYRLASPSHSIRRFDAMHGGKRVRLLTWENGQYLSDLTYQSPAGTWRRGASVPRDSSLWPVEGSGGGFNSTHRTPGQDFGHVSLYSHGADSVVQLRTVPDANGYGAGARLTLVHSGGTRELAFIPSPVSVGPNHASDCWIRRMDTGNCVQGVDYVHQSRSVEWSGAYSPLGDSLYVAARVLRHGSWLDAWEPCPVPPQGDTINDSIPDEVVRECRPLVSGSGVDSVGTVVYGVEVRTGQYRELWRGPSARLTILGATEDGREYLTRQEQGGELERTHFYLIRPTSDAPYWVMRRRYVPYSNTVTCGLQYHDAGTGNATYLAIAPRADCVTGVDAQGAPLRARRTR